MFCCIDSYRKTQVKKGFFDPKTQNPGLAFGKRWVFFASPKTSPQNWFNQSAKLIIADPKSISDTIVVHG
jgi:hypothetical protein